MRINTARVSTALLAALLLASASFSQKPTLPNDDGVLEPVTTKKDLYPTDADAKKEIDDALKRATVEKKRVLLIFGGNWGYACHVLHRPLPQAPPAKTVKQSFLLCLC